MRNKEALEEKAKKIKFLLLDVDGIMTDGKIFLDGQGNEFKSFHIHDGHGIYLLRKSGIEVGIISGRNSKAVEYRARELNIREVHQSAIDKVKIYEDIKAKYNLDDEYLAFMGDDLIDLPLLNIVGFSVTAADAVSAVKEVVDMITEKNGGEGAVREIIDFILNTKSKP